MLDHHKYGMAHVFHTAHLRDVLEEKMVRDRNGGIV
jgi:hypothetical protein